MKTGVVAQMIISVQAALAPLLKNSLNDLPIASSTLNMSAEKRLSMRPIGVVSKKLIGLRNIA